MRHFQTFFLALCLVAVPALKVGAQRGRYNSGNQNSNSRPSYGPSNGNEQNPDQEGKVDALEYIIVHIPTVAKMRNMTKVYSYI